LEWRRERGRERERERKREREKEKAKLFVDYLAENGELLLKLVGEFMNMDDL
jgi:hypothetical protein